MTSGNSSSQTHVSTVPTAAESKQIVLDEIGAKWRRFSEQDLSELVGRDDLVTQVVARYSIETAGAEREVDAVLKGRLL